MSQTFACLTGQADRHRDSLLQPMLTLEPAEINSEVVEGRFATMREVVSRVCRSKEVGDCEQNALLSTKNLRFCCAL